MKRPTTASRIRWTGGACAVATGASSRKPPSLRTMSSQTEVVRRQFEVLGSGGVDAAAELWHSDIEWRAVEGAADDVGVMRGAAAVRSYYEDWFDTLEDLTAEVEEVIAEAGDRVCVVVRNSGRG